MVGEGAYPPGVTGKMIDALEGPDDMWIPEPCCGYCEMFDGSWCTKNWNNLDPAYRNPEKDERDDSDWCEDYQWNGETLEAPRKPEKPVRRKNQTDMQWTWTMRHYRQEMNRWRKAMLILKQEEERNEL